MPVTGLKSGQDLEKPDLVTVQLPALYRDGASISSRLPLSAPHHAVKPISCSTSALPINCCQAMVFKTICSRSYGAWEIRAILQGAAEFS